MASKFLQKLTSGGKGHDQSKITVNELSMYDEPKVEFEIVHDTPSSYDIQVSRFRQAIWGQIIAVQDAKEKIKQKYDTGVSHSKEALYTFKDDTRTLPRATLITLAGMTGIIAGYKGGVFRKTLFAATGMTSAAAICYPQEAVNISTKGWNKLKTEVLSLVKPNHPEERVKEIKKIIQEKTAPFSDESKVVEKSNNLKEDKADRNMSNPDDKDMYTTR